MEAKFTRLTHKIATQLHLVAESYTIRSPRSWRPVRKLLVTPSYSVFIHMFEMRVVLCFSRACSTTRLIGGYNSTPHFFTDRHTLVCK